VQLLDGQGMAVGQVHVHCGLTVPPAKAIERKIKISPIVTKRTPEAAKHSIDTLMECSSWQFTDQEAEAGEQEP